MTSIPTPDPSSYPPHPTLPLSRILRLLRPLRTSSNSLSSSVSKFVQSSIEEREREVKKEREKRKRERERNWASGEDEDYDESKRKKKKRKVVKNPSRQVRRTTIDGNSTSNSASAPSASSPLFAGMANRNVTTTYGTRRGRGGRGVAGRINSNSNFTAVGAQSQSFGLHNAGSAGGSRGGGGGGSNSGNGSASHGNGNGNNGMRSATSFSSNNAFTNRLTTNGGMDSNSNPFISSSSFLNTNHINNSNPLEYRSDDPSIQFHHHRPTRRLPASLHASLTRLANSNTNTNSNSSQALFNNLSFVSISSNKPFNDTIRNVGSDKKNSRSTRSYTTITSKPTVSSKGGAGLLTPSSLPLTLPLTKDLISKIKAIDRCWKNILEVCYHYHHPHPIRHSNHNNNNNQEGDNDDDNRRVIVGVTSNNTRTNSVRSAGMTTSNRQRSSSSRETTKTVDSLTTLAARLVGRECIERGWRDWNGRKGIRREREKNAGAERGQEEMGDRSDGWKRKGRSGRGMDLDLSSDEEEESCNHSKVASSSSSSSADDENSNSESESSEEEEEEDDDDARKGRKLEKMEEEESDLDSDSTDEELREEFLKTEAAWVMEWYEVVPWYCHQTMLAQHAMTIILDSVDHLPIPGLWTMMMKTALEVGGEAEASHLLSHLLTRLSLTSSLHHLLTPNFLLNLKTLFSCSVHGDEDHLFTSAIRKTINLVSKSSIISRHATPNPSHFDSKIKAQPHNPIIIPLLRSLIRLGGSGILDWSTNSPSHILPDPLAIGPSSSSSIGITPEMIASGYRDLKPGGRGIEMVILGLEGVERLKSESKVPVWDEGEKDFASRGYVSDGDGIDRDGGRLGSMKLNVYVTAVHDLMRSLPAMVGWWMQTSSGRYSPSSMMTVGWERGWSDGGDSCWDDQMRWDGFRGRCLNFLQELEGEIERLEIFEDDKTKAQNEDVKVKGKSKGKGKQAAKAVIAPARAAKLKGKGHLHHFNEADSDIDFDIAPGQPASPDSADQANSENEDLSPDSNDDAFESSTSLLSLIKASTNTLRGIVLVLEIINLLSLSSSSLFSTFSPSNEARSILSRLSAQLTVSEIASLRPLQDLPLLGITKDERRRIIQMFDDINFSHPIYPTIPTSASTPTSNPTSFPKLQASICRVFLEVATQSLGYDSHLSISSSSPNHNHQNLNTSSSCRPKQVRDVRGAEVFGREEWEWLEDVRKKADWKILESEEREKKREGKQDARGDPRKSRHNGKNKTMVSTSSNSVLTPDPRRKLAVPSGPSLHTPASASNNNDNPPTTVRMKRNYRWEEFVGDWVAVTPAQDSGIRAEGKGKGKARERDEIGMASNTAESLAPNRAVKDKEKGKEKDNSLDSVQSGPEDDETSCIATDAITQEDSEIGMDISPLRPFSLSQDINRGLSLHHIGRRINHNPGTLPPSPRSRKRSSDSENIAPEHRNHHPAKRVRRPNNVDSSSSSRSTPSPSTSPEPEPRSISLEPPPSDFRNSSPIDPCSSPPAKRLVRQRGNDKAIKSKIATKLPTPKTTNSETSSPLSTTISRPTTRQMKRSVTFVEDDSRNNSNNNNNNNNTKLVTQKPKARAFSRTKSLPVLSSRQKGTGLPSPGNDEVDLHDDLDILCSARKAASKRILPPRAVRPSGRGSLYEDTLEFSIGEGNSNIGARKVRRGSRDVRPSIVRRKGSKRGMDDDDEEDEDEMAI